MDAKKSRGRAPAPDPALVAHLQQRTEAERGRLARLLHHDVSGMLAAARMDLSRLIARVAADEDVAEQLRRVDQLIAQVIGDARAEMQRLHPALIDHFGLPVALRHLIDESCRARGCVFTLEFIDESAGLDAPLPMAVYRMVETILAAEGLQEFTATCCPRPTPTQPAPATCAHCARGWNTWARPGRSPGATSAGSSN
jgi:signal transduction histidine kinase